MTALLTAGEMAKRLGISRSRAYELIEAADIEVVRMGRLVRVTETPIEDYIRRNTTPARSQRRLRSSA